ncbi:MAG: glycosyltransferase [Anaerolineaceae bacterium]
MKVLFWGTYRENYSRNQLILDGLRKVGVEIIVCHETLWKSDEDRENIARGKWIFPSFWFRVISSYCKLLVKFFTIRGFDIIYVPYPGQFDIYLAKLFSIIRKKPLVWDVLNSFFLIMNERKIYGNFLERFSLTVIKTIEQTAFRLPDLLFLDNEKFVNWICETFAINQSKFRLIPISADSRFFYPSSEKKSEIGVFNVLYYGSYIPNHGLALILQAADLLKSNSKIRFILAGDGPEKANSIKFVEENCLQNVAFEGWLSKDELIHRIWDSQIILGAFGHTLQSSLTNNNKIIEAFAAKKPVISCFTEALPIEIKHGKNIHLCKAGDSNAIAESIEYLVNNPSYCEELSENAYFTYVSNFENFQIGNMVFQHLKQLL